MKLNDPIPKIDFSLPQVSVGENGERLVDLTKCSDKIVAAPAYYADGIPGAVNECLARETVAKKLVEVSERLPEGLKIKVFDAWRPFEVQKFLYEQYRAIVRADNPNLTERELENETQKFVSLPQRDVFASPVHSTGGAVDLTLIDKHGNELNMGTAFDAFSEQSNTAYYEYTSSPDSEARENRRLLYNLMIQAGFTNLPTEWWHFDYGDKFWAHYSGGSAIYAGIF